LLHEVLLYVEQQQEPRGGDPAANAADCHLQVLPGLLRAGFCGPNPSTATLGACGAASQDADASHQQQQQLLLLC
jgi:hypothetical protein